VHGEDSTKTTKATKTYTVAYLYLLSRNKSKRELLRVVRTPDGHVMIDATGKKSGRGAYLCARLSCWENAIKKHRFEQEFELPLSEEDRAGLDAYIATLPKDEPATTVAAKGSSTHKKGSNNSEAPNT